MVRIAPSIPGLSVSDVIPEHANMDTSFIEVNNVVDEERHDDGDEEGICVSRDSCHSDITPINLDGRTSAELSNLNFQLDTATDSNRPSFTSTLNSFIGLTSLTRGKYCKRSTNSVVGTVSVAPSFDFADGHMNPLGTPVSMPKPMETQHRQSVDAFNKSNTVGTPLFDGGKKGGGALGKPMLSDVHGKQNWLQQQGDGKALKNSATSSCTLFMKEEKSKKDVKQKGKSKVEQSQGKNAQYRHDFHAAMPSCYVISKNRDSIYRRMCVGTQNNISVVLNSRKTREMMSHSRGGKHDDDGSTSQPRSSPKTRLQDYQRDVATNSARQQGMSKMFNYMKSRWYNIPSRAHASVVTVVNKGSSNILILKFQSQCRNYMDINPDFGWRRLVEEYTPMPPQLKSGTNQNVTAVKDETSAQQSYMYYREAKKSTHAMGLAELSINIACRTFVLGVAQGIIDDTDLPEFIHEILRQQYGSWDVKKRSQDDSRGKTVQRAMYQKSSSLGLFVTSSITSILGSAAYKESMIKSKRSFMWNMPSKGNEEQEMCKEATSELPNVYRVIPIPDYGWRLIERSQFDKRITRIETKKVEQSRFMKVLCKIFCCKSSSRRRNATIYSNTVLCKVKPPHITNRKAFLQADVGSMAMNIAEQLYRLEVRQQTREKLPKNTFGFQVLSQNLVISPCGREFTLIPEELILNTATLIHEMYVTQPCLIL